jgi:pentapeptide repeat protein
MEVGTRGSPLSLYWRRRSTRSRAAYLALIATVVGGALTAYVLLLSASARLIVAAALVGLCAFILSFWVVWPDENGEAKDVKVPSRPERKPALALTRVDLRDAALPDAKLEHTELNEATLAGANLKSAILDSAQMADSDLRGADLRGADLSCADLSGADLRGTQIAGAEFQGARYDDRTLWPDDTPAEGAVHVKEGAGPE